MLFKLIYKFLIFLLIFAKFNLKASNPKIDSLQKLYNSTINDTLKIKYGIQLGNYYSTNNPKQSIQILIESYKLSQLNNYKPHIVLYDLAFNYCEIGEYEKSLLYYNLCEKNCSKLVTPKKEDWLSRIYEGRTNVYERNNNIDAAIKNQKIAININNSINDTLGILISSLNLARLYNNINEYNEAYKIYNHSQYSVKNKKDSIYLLYIYNGIGCSLQIEKKYDLAIEYFKKSMTILLKFDSENLIYQGHIMFNLGESFYGIKQQKLSLEYVSKAVVLYKTVGSFSHILSCYKSLAKIYSDQNNSALSSFYYEKYVQLDDSIDNATNTDLIHEMSAKYESDKKDKENELLSLENNNKKQIIYFAFGGCILLLGLVFFIFKGYKNKQKANLILEDKNTIIQQQKTIVEEQNHDIKDSIRYAQRIQGAILPPKNMWQKMLPNSFLLYMPKDILSGDFYWVEETKDYVYVAAADCTGHGVPGALVSIVNFNLLNKAVLEKDLVTPSDILDAVNIWLTESLHQSYGESAVRDGMDVTLIAIHKHSNEVLFTGANNPIYHISNGELLQIKGDKFPVGAFIEDKIQKFTTKRFTVEKGDSIFLFSDGYADQFGGPKGKKYKYAQFQEKLKNNHNLPLNQQLNIMKTEFTDWKGALEQVDDVLLIGIKIV